MRAVGCWGPGRWQEEQFTSRGAGGQGGQRLGRAGVVGKNAGREEPGPEAAGGLQRCPRAQGSRGPGRTAHPQTAHPSTFLAADFKVRNSGAPTQRRGHAWTAVACATEPPRSRAEQETQEVL